MDFGAIEPLTKIANQFLPGKDTDAIDRLNSFITPSLMVFAAVLIAGKQWLGQPLQCWLDKRYNGFEEEYIERYCFVNGTYFIPLNGSDIPTQVQHREDAKLAYYQWLPIVLALQALLSSAPLTIWRMLSPKSGINLKHAICTALEVVNKQGDDRKSKLESLAKFVDYTFGLQRHYRMNKLETRASKFIKAALCWVPFVGSKYGNYLPGFYLLFKVLLLIVGIAQLFIFNAFLDSPGHFYAIDFLHQFRAGYDWNTTGLFPRVTLCDFTLLTLGNKQRHTVQCVLVINFLVEKIYVFLWFWMLVMVFFTFINILMWLERTLFDRARRTFVSTYLHAAVGYKRMRDEEERLYNFVKYYLCGDGVFLLRLVSFNVGIPITASLVNELWEMFLNNAMVKRDNRTSESDNEKESLADDSV